MRKYRCITKQFSESSPKVIVTVEARDVIDACRKVVQILGYEPYVISVIEIKGEEA